MLDINIIPAVAMLIYVIVVDGYLIKNFIVKYKVDEDVNIYYSYSRNPLCVDICVYISIFFSLLFFVMVLFLRAGLGFLLSAFMWYLSLHFLMIFLYWQKGVSPLFKRGLFKLGLLLVMSIAIIASLAFIFYIKAFQNFPWI